MPNLNHISLAGHLGQDPETKFTQGNAQITTFTLATNRNYKKGDEWKTEVEWHKIICFGKTAEMAEKLSKGDGVFVEGRLTYNDWTDKQDRTHHDAQIKATVVGKFEREQKGGREERQRQTQRNERNPYSPPPPEDEIPF